MRKLQPFLSVVSLITLVVIAGELYQAQSYLSALCIFLVALNNALQEWRFNEPVQQFRPAINGSTIW